MLFNIDLMAVRT